MSDVKLRDTCTICSKKAVCKYEESFKKFVDKVSDIQEDYLLTPFDTLIKCEEFNENKLTRSL